MTLKQVQEITQVSPFFKQTIQSEDEIPSTILQLFRTPLPTLYKDSPRVFQASKNWFPLLRHPIDASGAPQKGSLATDPCEAWFGYEPIQVDLSPAEQLFVNAMMGYPSAPDPIIDAVEAAAEAGDEDAQLTLVLTFRIQQFVYGFESEPEWVSNWKQIDPSSNGSGSAEISAEMQMDDLVAHFLAQILFTATTPETFDAQFAEISGSLDKIEQFARNHQATWQKTLVELKAKAVTRAEAIESFNIYLPGEERLSIPSIEVSHSLILNAGSIVDKRLSDYRDAADYLDSALTVFAREEGYETAQKLHECTARLKNSARFEEEDLATAHAATKHLKPLITVIREAVDGLVDALEIPAEMTSPVKPCAPSILVTP